MPLTRRRRTRRHRDITHVSSGDDWSYDDNGDDNDVTVSTTDGNENSDFGLTSDDDDDDDDDSDCDRDGDSDDDNGYSHHHDYHNDDCRNNGSPGETSNLYDIENRRTGDGSSVDRVGQQPIKNVQMRRGKQKRKRKRSKFVSWVDSIFRPGRRSHLRPLCHYRCCNRRQKEKQPQQQQDQLRRRPGRNITMNSANNSKSDLWRIVYKSLRICLEYCEVMGLAVIGIMIMSVLIVIMVGSYINTTRHNNGGNIGGGKGGSKLILQWAIKILAPIPGKNYWQWHDYWARPKPNTIDPDSLEQLRHDFPIRIGQHGDPHDANGNDDTDFEIIQHPGTTFLSSSLLSSSSPDDEHNAMMQLLEQYRTNLTLASAVFGVDSLDEIQQRLVVNLTVPKFWNPPIFQQQLKDQKQQQQQRSQSMNDAIGANGRSGVRNFLGNNGEYLIAPEEAAAIGSYVYYNDDGGVTKTVSGESVESPTKLETILVMIASYRDPECHPTVEDVFQRAKFPQRIRVAIVDQRVDPADTENGIPKCGIPRVDCSNDPNQPSCVYERQIDRIEYDARSMVGPTFARHLANRMYRGEYFVLQVDSHVRFTSGWDDDVVNQWKSTGNEMAVITTYMNDITKSLDPETHVSLRPSRAMMCKSQYEWPGEMEHIKFDIQPIKRPSSSQTTPALHPLWAAGFSFGRGHSIVQVPYDPYLPFVFQGEEILQSIRLFTYGYDFYAPIRNVAFHIYAMKQNTEARSTIHKFDENELLFPGVKKEAYKRLVAISGTSALPQQYFHQDEDRYGVGNVRTRSQFFSTFGIDPSSKTIEDGLCDFVQGTGGARSMHDSFKDYLRYDSMGIDYERIWYQHRAPDRTETYVSPQELERLRGLLLSKRQEGTSAGKNN